MDVDEDDVTCWVCMELFGEGVTRLPCSHAFCRRCLLALAQQQQQQQQLCPMCRTPYALPLPPSSPRLEALARSFVLAQQAALAAQAAQSAAVSARCLGLGRDEWLCIARALLHMHAQRPACLLPLLAVCRSLRRFLDDAHLWRRLALQDFAFCDVSSAGSWRLAYARCARLGRGWSSGDARAWKVTSLRGPESPVTALCVGGTQVWCGYLDGSVRGFRDGKECAAFAVQDGHEVTQLLLQADTLHALDASGAHSVFREGRELPELRRAGPFEALRVVEHTVEGGARVAPLLPIAGGRSLRYTRDGGAQILLDGGVVATLNGQQDHVVADADFAVLISGATASIYRVSAGTFEKTGDILLSSPMNAAYLSGRRLVTAHQDHCVRVSDIEDRKILYCLLGGSLRARDDNPPHPRKPGCSFLFVDYGKLVATFNAVAKVFSLVE